MSTTERLCWSCLKGTIVELEDGAVCTHCRRHFTAVEIAPLPPLTELLLFAEMHPRANGTQIRAAFGISRVRFVAALNRAIDQPEVAKVAPVFAEALRERRDHMEAARDVTTLRHYADDLQSEESA